MNKIIKQILILACLIAVLVLPYFVFADDGASTPTMKGYLETVGGKGGYETSGINETSMAAIAGTAVKAFLSLLGIIFIILTLYGGYVYMMARGNEEEVKKGIDIIRRAVIGLVLVVGSYAIWNFIVLRFLQQ